MLQRKLQTTGKGSYIVTLPRPIILALGLEKGIDFEVTLEGKKIVLNPVPQARQDFERTGLPTANTLRRCAGNE